MQLDLEKAQEAREEKKIPPKMAPKSVKELLEQTQEEDFVEEEDQAMDVSVLDALLDRRIAAAVKEMGFVKMTPIQEQAIPRLLEGEDIIGQAQTGTGKTAAFGIPLIQKVDPELRKLQAIVLCPTRELAIQAAEELRRLAKYMDGVKILPVYGGQDIGRQIAGLKGVQIIVGTPGRVMDHMRRRTLKLDNVSMVVLDEADEMLNMGFREDMELILGEIPNAHQTALFSATMPKPILEITTKFQKDAYMIKVAAKELTIPLVTQSYYRVRKQDKVAATIRLLEYYQPKLSLIFCNTKRMVDELAESLKQADFQAEGLHGDMSQHQRDVAMNRFRRGTTSILIATDVAARGIDVDDVEAVINFDIPQDIEYYVHRIGRTGRAGRSGRSFTLASGREVYRIRDIERVCRTTIEEMKLPGAAKVIKAKARKLLGQVWELRDADDLDVMRKYILRKMEEEQCEALDLAAMMLKHYVGDKGEDILVDESAQKPAGRGKGLFGGRGGERSEGRSRSSRGGDRSRSYREDRDGGRFHREGARSHREDRDGGRSFRDERRGDRDGQRRDRKPFGEGWRREGEREGRRHGGDTSRAFDREDRGFALPFMPTRRKKSED